MTSSSSSPSSPDCHLLNQQGRAGAGRYLAPTFSFLLHPTCPLGSHLWDLRDWKQQAWFGRFKNVSVKGTGRTLSPGISPGGGWGLGRSHCPPLV